MKNLKTMVLALVAALFAPVASASMPVKSTAVQPDWLKNAVIYEANVRQGTPERNFKGLQLQIPRLKDLGVSVIWVMPMHPISKEKRKGELGSYYAIQDYRKVNPEFGTMEDFKEFVRTAHANGIKVILDQVLNHTGCDNAYVTEHPDFYARNEQGEMYGPFDWTDVYQLDYSNPELRKEILSMLKFWIEETDIDGYRMDYAEGVPRDFWESAVVELNKIKPVFMLAEASKPDLLEKAFAADYNWPMKNVFNAISATQGENKWAVEHNENHQPTYATAILDMVAQQAERGPEGTIHMNMVTNHDLNSWEGTEAQRYGKGLEAFALLSFTLPGAPMIYNGQEVGFDHPFEFFQIDPVTPDYTANDYTAFYQMLCALKRTNRALDAGYEAGSFTPLPTTDKNIVAFERQKGKNRVIVIANLSGQEAKVQFTGKAPEVKGMRDYLRSEKAKLPKKLGPWESVLLVK